MQLKGDISVVDMGIDKATILNFIFNVSELDGVVTAVLSWPTRQSRSVKCLMALWCWDLEREKSSKVRQVRSSSLDQG